jgi:hypothetical protein
MVTTTEDGDAVTANRVDPAALLIAVLAVGVGPMTETGPWEPMNTIIATAVLMIIMPYAFAKQVRSGWLVEGPRLPIVVAIAFVFGVLAAWPIQAIWRTEDDEASYAALGVAGAVVVIFWTTLTVLARRQRARQKAVAASETGPDAG